MASSSSANPSPRPLLAQERLSLEDAREGDEIGIPEPLADPRGLGGRRPGGLILAGVEMLARGRQQQVTRARRCRARLRPADVSRERASRSRAPSPRPGRRGETPTRSRTAPRRPCRSPRGGHGAPAPGSAWHPRPAREALRSLPADRGPPPAGAPCEPPPRTLRTPARTRVSRKPPALVRARQPYRWPWWPGPSDSSRDKSISDSGLRRSKGITVVSEPAPGNSYREPCAFKWCSSLRKANRGVSRMRKPVRNLYARLYTAIGFPRFIIR